MSELQAGRYLYWDSGAQLDFEIVYQDRVGPRFGALQQGRY